MTNLKIIFKYMCTTKGQAHNLAQLFKVTIFLKLPANTTDPAARIATHCADVFERL